MKIEIEKPTVFIVKQYQSSCDIAGEPVAVFDSLDKAKKRCKELNKEFLSGVDFLDDDSPFSAYVGDNEDWHYYIIESFILN